MDKMTGIEELRSCVEAFNCCNEDFLNPERDPFTAEQLLAIWRAWRASDCDIYPDQWTEQQVKGALEGKAKRAIDEGLAVAEPAPAVDPVVADAVQTGIVLKRIAEIGQAEVARRVAPAWGWSPDGAQTRLSLWIHERRDMSSTAFLALLDVLGLIVTQKPNGPPLE